MKDFLILAPVVGIIAGLVFLDRQSTASADIWTTESCVTEKRQRWMTIRGDMPTDSEEVLFREECWADMGATINQG